MTAKRDARIMDGADAYPGSGNRYGYAVDLSQGDARNPDCFWRFRLKRHAVRFLALVDAGMSARVAYRERCLF